MKCQAVKGDVFSENRFVFNSWGDFAVSTAKLRALRSCLIIYDVIFHTMRKYAPAIPSILLLFCHLFLHLVPEKGFSLRAKCAIKAMADHFSIKLYAVVHFIILTGLEHRENNSFDSFHPQSRLYEMFILGSGRFSQSIDFIFVRSGRKSSVRTKKVEEFFLPSKAGEKINRTRQEKMAFHHSGRVPQSGECMPSAKKGQHRRDRRRKHFSNNCD